MQRLMVLSLFVSLIQDGNSQDVITMRTGEAYYVKVVEVTDRDVRFKMQGNLNGPLYVLNKSALSYLRIENGSLENLALVHSESIVFDSTIVVNGFNTSFVGANGASSHVECPTTLSSKPLAAPVRPEQQKRRAAMGNLLYTVLVIGVFALRIMTAS